MEQRTDEWHEARKGKVSGSRMAEAIGLTGSRRRLWRELTGREASTYQNAAMSWGTDFEVLARSLYEVTRGVEVQEVGFVNDPDYDWMGASPDGLVGVDGAVEFKCPFGPMYETAPTQYIVQCHGVMHATGRKWVDLMAWKEEESRIWRVHWSDSLWDEMLEHLLTFKSYIDLDVEPPKFKRGEKPTLSATVVIEAPITI